MFFHLAVQFSRYISGLSHASHALGFRRGFFQILCAFRFAFAHPSISGIFRSLKTIHLQEELFSQRRILHPDFFSLLHLAVYRPEMKPLRFRFGFLPRKEVIQPHLPIRLPCYDFTPVIGLTFDSWLLSVTSLASGAPNSHGVTGGVYKARERIHRGMLIRDY